MKAKRVYEARGGYASKNDVIKSLACTMEALADNHRGELVVPVYYFHVIVKEIDVNKITVADKENKEKTENAE